jgi:hypothetical protein
MSNPRKFKEKFSYSKKCKEQRFSHSKKIQRQKTPMCILSPFNSFSENCKLQRVMRGKRVGIAIFRQ